MTELTQTEAGAQRLINIENKAAKCKRCCGRMDFKASNKPDNYACAWGEYARARMQSPNPCPKFMLNEDQGEWLK